MSNTFFTAGTHFGHRSILSMCRRPFESIEEHDQALTDNWNSVVGPDDTVWHLGDFAYRCSPQRTREIFGELNGVKHLVTGNHDFKNETRKLPWASPTELTEVNLGGQIYVLCHYGLRSWRNMRRGSIQLFGHSHGRLPDTSQCIDVGVDNFDYRPVSLPKFVRA
ncbi:metallophosphoesterase family protein [Pelagibacterium halotolerans]|uniref:Phosphohydrolase (MutT/nudix family protein) n=1 Tax=Pelagibacterium halotolerans (strain DSM 22347 / JCM 15775 / CGMCC 1.7692 / B2) TaxID=1082931 RepID=G4RBI1_PELHB|nr:metallophosphoesterase [Pelagibacterium halotolerans]AEQ52657.1 phosphohydrolase (MutT/nudix family protein) [Pelagibacterium halotolerans B2]QJR17641.1 metallophosphoesterase [Pelagibacterium halotolerans]SEA83929.1 Calcineurin-like phosphoesterase superfamily protein [Pelagibacterium halotolerans]